MARSAVTVFKIAAQGCAEQAKAALVRVAKREHARIMSTDPKPARFTRWVDGRQGAAEETVKPTGVIRYRYHRLEEIVQVAMETLFDLSPVESGEYRMAHTIFVDGVASRNLSAWDGQSPVVILNPLPYSRKIEIGKMKMRVPGTDHVYEQAEIVLRNRFNNQASVVFTFRGYVAGGIAGAKGGGNKAGNRYPALVITPRR